LPSQERAQLLGWGVSQREYPREEGLAALFARQVQARAQAVAVQAGERTLSYAQLDAWSDRLAQALQAQGLAHGECVALSLGRSMELVVAQLGVLKAGGAYVPLDEVLPGARQALMAQDCGAKRVLARSGQALAQELAGLSRLDVDEEALAQWPAQAVGQQGRGEDLAYVMYTSGSTGTPKGVQVRQRGVARLVLNNGYAQFEAQDRVALAANPAFDATTLEVWAALLNGGAVVVIDQETLLQPQELAQELARQRVSVLWLTVGLFNQYEPQLAGVLPQLRYLIIGGEALDPRVVARVLERHAPQHLLNGYGPTETTTFALTHEVRHVARDASSIPLGRPIGNTRVYVLDEQGAPTPIGVAGEICIGGDGVARGYLNQPQLTEERFVADPFSEEAGARMYKTGDLGRWLADGTIEYLG
ncbi:amino acid adenylation domain-containing protein, partial [Roseateles flavus]